MHCQKQSWGRDMCPTVKSADSVSVPLSQPLRSPRVLLLVPSWCQPCPAAVVSATQRWDRFSGMSHWPKHGLLRIAFLVQLHCSICARVYRSPSLPRSSYGQARLVLLQVIHACTAPICFPAERLRTPLKRGPSPSFPHSERGAISRRADRKWMVPTRCLYRSSDDIGSEGRPAFPGSVRRENSRKGKQGREKRRGEDG